MPSVTVHLRLAEDVLDHWREHPADAPFSPDDDEAVNAFRLGAMGPDMGYLPGGLGIISDLAHSLWPADLARHLLAEASSPQQKAFSWGWVSHVLADILVHPLVGCAVGELVHGSPAVFVDGAQDQVSHVRVEVGLDAVYAQRYPELRQLPLWPAFDGSSIRFIRNAYRKTYGTSPRRKEILASHETAPRRLKQGLSLAGISALAMPSHPDETGRPMGRVGRVRSFVSRQSLSLAFLLPAPPRLWFLNAVRDVEETFRDIFLEEFNAACATLPNVNLDTGRPDVTETQYLGLRRAIDFLRSSGGRLPRLQEVISGAA